MNVMEAIEKRREITKYQKKPIEKEKLEKLLNAGYFAPAGNNLPSREFILVTKRDALQHLAQSTPFVPWLADAAAAIIVTGRPDISKYWLQDASIASGFIWLTAADLNIGAAFGAVYHAEDAVESKRREDFVRNALSIPADRRVIAILGLGYPEQEPAVKKLPARQSIVYYDQFNSKF